MDLKKWKVRACSCNKCGKAVTCRNCAVMYDLLIHGGGEVDLGTMSKTETIQGFCDRSEGRHLLPHGNCVGSPSRAQNVPDQPPDPRGYPTLTGAKLRRFRTRYRVMKCLPIP